jgi:leader peptidase (prepilin peptidase)/N-methyltransferase
MIRVLGTVFAALMGLAFGSFLNVCLTRWPAGESIVKPRSHCRNCGRTLKWWENVPLLSWLALRGRCRTCGTWIGWRYPLVEASVGGIWAYGVWRILPQLISPRFGLQSQYAISYIQLENLVATMLFTFVAVGLAVLDLEHLWLPDLVTFPTTVLGVLVFVALSAQMGWFFVMESTLWHDIGKRLLEVAIAAALILLIRWVYKFIRHREGLGLGDAKLMAMLAAWLGLPGALLSFAIGVVLGSVVAIVVLVGRKSHESSESWASMKLPLGTFLCIGGIVSSLWGKPIIAAYLKWAGF